MTEPLNRDGENELGYVSIWRTATGLRQWSVKATEKSSRTNLLVALQMAREIDRKLMHSRPRRKPEEPAKPSPMKVREKP